MCRDQNLPPDYDPRIVDLYDGDNPGGRDHDFYRALCRERQATAVCDLGCGTGQLTVTLDAPLVEGIDPSATMINFARQRPSADRVRWIHGDSSDLPPVRFDYALMTGNVVQHIDDDHWVRTLRDLRAGLVDGGALAFESRNPLVREWDTWDSGERTTRETQHGTLIEWAEVTELDGQTVEAAFHNHFVATGDTVTETQRFAFRTRETIEHDLRAAGFTVEAVYGDWTRTPLTDTDPVMIFVASAA